MRRSRWMNILTLVAFVMGTLSFAAPQAPVAAGVVEEAPPVPGAALPLPDNRQPPPHLKEVPAEIQELFADGMPAEEFVARAGYVPRALEGIVDGEALMIIELEEKPVAVRYAEQKEAGRVMTQATLDSHIQSLEAAQAGLEPQLAALGVERIISRYTVVYNGFQAFVPLSRLNEIRALPGVKAVHRAPLHEPSLGSSVDLIGAYDVWEDLGVDGEDITIAVIDTGIDYTHAAFGGPGTALAYDLNDPDFIEPNTFPTAKVIDGYDFVGTLYDPDCSAADEAAGICTVIPHPDPDPLDEVDHGTHVASIAAGIAVGDVMTGTAPGATLMALKVFGRTGGTYLTLNALEWATLRYLYTGKPEVINMSLGAPFGTGDLTDPSVRGTHNAAGVGIVVASAAGNADDSSYITDSPGSADRAISVAASTTGYATGPTISIEDTAYVTQTNIIYSTSSFDAGGEFDEEVVAPLGYVGNLAGAADNELCTTDGIAANALAGQVALIQRGSCAFSVKVNNAAALGAVAAMIYNNTAGVVTMIGDPVLIPAGFIQMQDGLNLTPADGETAIVSAQDDVTTTLDPYTPPDSIATFSSRGPRGTDSFLKPEITAPGVGIFAANMGSGTGGVSKGGTSMATPHVAGVAALMMQANPGWTPEEIKAAMMNTAVDLADGTPIVRSGAGRVDAHRAVDTEIIAVGDEDLVSLSYGVGFTGNDSWAPAKQVTVHNGGDEDVTYDVAAAFQSGSWTTGVSLDVDPDQVTVPAGGSAVVNVTLNVDMTQIPVLYGGGGLEEVYGFVTFTPPVYQLFLPLVAKNRGTTTAAVQGDVQPARLFSAEDALRVPFYVQPRPYSQLDTEADTEILDPRTDMAVITMTHTGPITASTWIYPALVWDDAPDPTMEGPGDVRMFGLDYGWPDGTFGDMIAVAINAWDYWHVPQPYFAEFDLYIDADQDGVDDYVNFNFNYGWFGGGDSDNTWVVLQVDLATGALYLASPYLIYTDYNASFMEYYLPAVWQDLGPTNSTFDYQLFGFDEGGVSVNPRGSFDYVNYPFAWAITNDPGPADDEALGFVGIASAGGTAYSQPEGVMLVDYNGDPRNVNGGQAYFVPIDVEIQSFTLLHTNDTHARLEPFQPWGEPVQGGVARRYTAIQEVKAEGRNVILLDAGDAFQGTLFFNVWQGEEEAYFMNALGYQAMAVGNHEFDSGPAALADFIDLADFPVLSANIDASAEPTLAGLIEAYTVLDVGGEQVGVFGLTTEETSILSSPGPNVVFNDVVTAAQATVAELEGMGINKIIALTHLGYGPDQALAAAVDGIDVIVGGHSHTLLGSMEGAAGPYPTVVDSPSGDPVLVVTAQDWGRYLGRLDVAFTADGELIGYSGEPIFIDESIAEDPAIAADVVTFAEPIEDLKNTVIGESAVLLEGTRALVRSQETNLGNLICDAMLWATASEGTQICMQNGGGIRASIPPGDVTMGQVLEVLPFGNQIATFGLTGADVWAALENGVSQWESGAGRFPQVGGLKYVFDPSLPVGSRIVSADVKQGDGTYEPIDLEEVYKLTSNDFMRSGGDGYSMFAENAIDPYDAGAVLADAVADYIGENSPVSPAVEGRITKLDMLVTILHTNDVHGRFPADSYRGTPQGMAYLASHIAAERAKNPNTLLLDAGDTFQGNAFAQYFRNETPNPIAGAMNLLDYDAMVVGNHEFNFGSATFATMLGQLDFPILGSANVDDDGTYGFINDSVDDYITLDVDGLDVAIFGLTNPEVPLYELPSNIEGLTFYTATTTAETLVPEILADEDPDLLIALTHIGYDVYKGSYDKDKAIAEQVPGIDVIVGGHSHTRLDPAVMITSTVNPTGTLVAQTRAYGQYLGKINVGFTGNSTDGYEVVFREGYLLEAKDTTEDAAMVAYLAPYGVDLEDYTEQVIGQTTAPIDALDAYTEETTGANLQADAAVHVLRQEGLAVDIHLSGAMSARKVADDATPENPVELTVGDMYTLMPYENSLLVMEMNGPQLKAVLERAYRNYYYYKYVEGYGGYSHYTTCMLDINEGGVITYNDTYPALPDGNNVVSLSFNGTEVDFADADTYYNVSSVNYLAAGSCNFNDDGLTLWPLDQIVADTQFYVRDAVISYVLAMGTVSPEVEGRLQWVTP